MATYEGRHYSEPAVNETNRVIERYSADEDFPAVPATGDLMKIFPLPKQAKLLGGSLEIEALCATGGTVDLIVTDGVTEKVLLNDKSSAAAAHFDAASEGLTGWKGFITTSGDFYLAVRIVGEGTTPAVGSVRAGVLYTNDIEGGE